MSAREVMMGETLDNLGRSPLASTRMRVVLAMEAGQPYYDW